MKVQCDVCSASVASIFCCADEAALCGPCDRRVHRANKLAGKHRRFPLIHAAEPSSAAFSAQKTKPLCDICQERKGFFFCKEERSILCRECDVRVHTATELMRRHSRFLLTDAHLSPAPVDSLEEEEEEEEEENGSSSHSYSASDGSSISEYLTKTLPGWHVEDFLVDADITAACSENGLDDQGEGGQVQVDGLLEEACPAWAAPGGQQVALSDVVVTGDEGVSWVQCVPQMQVYADWTGSKRPRESLPCPYW